MLIYNAEPKTFSKFISLHNPKLVENQSQLATLKIKANDPSNLKN